MDIWPVRGGGCAQMRGLGGLSPSLLEEAILDLRQNCSWGEPRNNPEGVLRHSGKGVGMQGL